MAAPFDFYPAVGQAVEARLDGVWRSVVLIGSPGQDELTWTVCPAPPGERHASDSTDSTVSTVAEAALEYIKAHRQTWLSWLQREKLAGHGHDPARHAPETVQRFHAAAMAGWGRAVHFGEIRPLPRAVGWTTPSLSQSDAPEPEPEPEPEHGSTPLRILALHGGYQNAAVFDAVRTKDFQRRLKDSAAFTFLDGPILATPHSERHRVRRSWFKCAATASP